MKPIIRIRRLRIAEEIKINDWCCDNRANGPVKIECQSLITISKNHHPHYRIVSKTENRKPN